MFQKKDVINVQTAMDELMEIGVMTTPVTVIDGEVVVGFNRKKLEELLAAYQSYSQPGGGNMEGVSGALVFLVVAACCGLPILLLGAARLFNRTKNLQEEIFSAQREKTHGTNDSDRSKLGRRQK